MVARTKTPGRDQTLTCERCSGKLLFDGESLACLMCGYEPAGADRVRRPRNTTPELLDALVHYRLDVAHYLEAVGVKPLAGSPAEREICAAEAEESAALSLVPALAHQSLFAAGHGLIALARGLEPPAPEYGTWGVSSAVLQATGIVAWLLDPSIDPSLRALRALAVEATELRAESTVLSRDFPGQPSVDGPFANAITQNEERTQRIVARSRHAAPAYIPVIEELASLLDATLEQRLFSSIVAGRPWALLQSTAIAAPFGANPDGSIVAFQVGAVAGWYAHGAWAYARWMQPAPGEDLCGALERGFNTLDLADDERTRFWRAVPSAERGARPVLRSVPSR